MSEAMLNDPTASLSGVRTPRFRVLANGYQIDGVSEVEVQSNNHYSADTFSIDLEIYLPGSANADFLGGTDEIIIEIQVGFNVTPDTALPSLFIGRVDNVEVDPISGGARLTGRDLSSNFIDAKTQETFQNNTSSEIATKLAEKYGLTPVVTSTDTLVSRYYKEDHDHITNDQFSRTTTEWDLLTYLAQLEGFDLFVHNLELHFQPATDASSPPFIVRLDRSGSFPICNVESLHLTRSLTLAKDIEVWVRSWLPHKKTGHTKKSVGKKSKNAVPATQKIGADSFIRKAGSPGKNTQRIVVIRPNLTEDAAQKLANSIRADLTQHERVVEFTLPGDESPTPRDLVRVEGTDSSWDQTYFVSSVTRRIGWATGYTMDVKAKNTSPENESVPG